MRGIRGYRGVGYSGGFGFVDGLVTNFHVPRSSLMMLVAASAVKNLDL